MMTARLQPLAQHDLQPGVDLEQLARRLEQVAAFAEQGDALGQAVGDLHLAHAVPERAVGPFGQLVVQDDEVADLLQLVIGQAVVALDHGGADPVEREQLHQPADPDHDHVDRGGLQRLDEAAGQTQRHDVLIPGLAPLAGAVADQARRDQGLTLDLGRQHRLGLVVAHVVAAIDKAVANPVLQRDLPAPAGPVRDGAGIGNGGADRTGLDGQGAVGWQPMAPILVSGLQGLLDQQTPEASAIDEQVALDDGAGLHDQRLDMAIGAALANAGDLALDAARAGRLGHAAQELAVEAGVEVVGVVQPGVVAGGKPFLLGRPQLQAVVPQIAAKAPRPRLEPEVMEAAHPGGFADLAERVDVAIADLAPVFEQDAQLEGGLGGAHERRLVDPQQGVEGARRGDGRLPDADRADVLGLDQGDVQQRAELP